MRPSDIQTNTILKLTFDFSLDLIKYCEQLDTSKKFAVANQLLKAGTSVGANAIEAQNAESKPDFIHKLKIAAKEAGEAQYWLLLCEHSTNYPPPGELLTKIEEINRVLAKILSTSKSRYSN